MEPSQTNLKRSRLHWGIPLVAGLAAAGFLAWWFASKSEAPPPAPTPVAAAPSPAQKPEEAPPPAVVDESPVGPEGARALLEAASKNPLFHSWLDARDLVRRWAVVTANVSEGTSPRGILRFLAPRGPFSVEQREGGPVIAPESYARYDAVADAVDSIDAHAIASAYRRLHAAIEAAYRALGYPKGSLDRATARALHRIEGTPLPKDDVRVELQDGIYVFQDASLEQLDDVQKHLLRMGPRNERLIQGKARQLREALALPAVAAAGK